MHLVALFCELGIGAATIITLISRGESTKHALVCRFALALHLIALFCELGIGAATIITIISREDSTTSDVLFLCASLLTTLAVAGVNVMGSKALIQALIASGKRVQHDVMSGVARVSRVGRKSMGDAPRRSVADAPHSRPGETLDLEPAAPEPGLELPLVLLASDAAPTA